MQLGDLGFLGSLTGPLFDPLDDSYGYGREVYGDGRIRLARRWFGYGCEVTEGADGSHKCALDVRRVSTPQGQAVLPHHFR